MPFGMETGLHPGHTVRWETSSPIRGTAAPPIFSPSLLWLNGWMDQHATWYRGRLQRRQHCARWHVQIAKRFELSTVLRATGHSTQYSHLVFWLCMKYLGNCWTDLRPIHMEDVFGPSLKQVWRSRSKVKGQGHQRQKKEFFSALSAACVRFMFGKTSLGSSLTSGWVTARNLDFRTPLPGISKCSLLKQVEEENYRKSDQVHLEIGRYNRGR